MTSQQSRVYDELTAHELRGLIVKCNTAASRAADYGVSAELRKMARGLAVMANRITN